MVLTMQLVLVQTSQVQLQLVLLTNDVNVAELNTVAGKAFPNPANDVVTVAIEGEGTAQLTVTDVAGKVAMTTTLNLAAGQDNVNINTLETGLYIFNVTLENGKTAQFNVVKK